MSTVYVSDRGAWRRTLHREAAGMHSASTRPLEAWLYGRLHNLREAKQAARQHSCVIY